MDGRPPEPAPDETAPRPPGDGAGAPDAEDSVDLGATNVVPAPEAESDTAVVSGRVTEAAPPKRATISSRLGDYRLVRKLGQGAMAAVYKA